MKNIPSDLKPVKSFLILETFVFFNWYYSFFFFFINLSLLVYKSMAMYYPSNQLTWDLMSCFLHAFLEGVRLLHFMKGNTRLDIESLLVALIFSIPILAYHGYSLNLQTYVTRIDIVMNSAAIFMVCSEFILGSVALGMFYLHSIRY